MSVKVQLNFQVSPKIANRFRADARRNNKSLDVVGEVILGDFFRGYSATERAKFYAQFENKIVGRKIGAKPR
jgi:hypothetical protein